MTNIDEKNQPLGLKKIIEDVLSLIISTLKENGQTDEQIEELMSSEEFDEIYVKLIDKFIEDTTTNITQNIHEYDKEELASNAQDLNYIQSVWGNAFSYLRIFYVMCLDICEEYRQFVNEEKYLFDRPSVAQALYFIHAKSMLVYAETICLLENGYPDGAIAHWRTLFELYAIAVFLNDNNDDVSKEYINSFNDKSNDEQSKYKWARKSGRFAEEKGIGISAIISEMYKILKEQGTIDISKKKFLDGYNFANLILHPSAKGVFGRVSNLQEVNSIAVGRSDYGLDVAAINSVTVLYEITVLHLAMFPSAISYIGINLLRNIWKDNIEPEINSIRSQFIQEDS